MAQAREGCPGACLKQSSHFGHPGHFIVCWSVVPPGSRCLEGRGSFEEISTIRFVPGQKSAIRAAEPKNRLHAGPLGRPPVLRCGGGPGRAAVQGQGQGGFPGGDHAALAALGGPACAAQGPTSQGRVVPGAGRLSAGTVAAGADPSHGGESELQIPSHFLPVWLWT